MQQNILNLRVKLKRIKTLKKGQKSKEQRPKKKKTMHYKFRLKGETKNNETFIKKFKEKNKKIIKISIKS